VNPAAGAPVPPTIVLDCRNPPLVLPGSGILDDVSIPLVVQLVLNTQLIAGALTFTTLSTCASASRDAASNEANKTIARTHLMC
jgi:hypothetical protein